MNCKNGNSAYVSIRGLVYDVTEFAEWENGEHYHGLVAGQDWTTAIRASWDFAKLGKQYK